MYNSYTIDSKKLNMKIFSKGSMISIFCYIKVKQKSLYQLFTKNHNKKIHFLRALNKYTVILTLP